MYLSPPTVLANVAEPPEAQTGGSLHLGEPGGSSCWDHAYQTEAGGGVTAHSLGCEPGCQRLLGKPLLGSLARGTAFLPSDPRSQRPEARAREALAGGGASPEAAEVPHLLPHPTPDRVFSKPDAFCLMSSRHF